MEKKRFRVGSITVLFAVVILCVAIFGALTVATAITDRRTAQRYGEYVEALYRCENAGQQWLSQADAYLKGQGPMPGNTEETPEQLKTEITCDSQSLVIRLAIRPEGYEILEWRCSSSWDPEDSWSLEQ